MGTEEAILYSYDLATLPSIIPAFASKKDLIICDEVGACCLPGGLAGRLVCHGCVGRGLGSRRQLLPLLPYHAPTLTHPNHQPSPLACPPAPPSLLTGRA